jgi:hypothetical protein
MRLSLRALNRAALARQHLLSRYEGSAYDVVSWLGGMQSQQPQSAYVGLWSRVSGFDPEELSALLVDRRLVRIALQRNTVHLVTADDALSWRPAAQVIFDRDLKSGAYSKGLRDVDLPSVASFVRELLVEPLPGPALRAALVAQFPGVDPASLAHAARGVRPLVQVPPRGLWGKGGQVTYADAEAWLSRSLAEPDVEGMVLRYLRAYGPSTVGDLQIWCGLARLREVVERLPLRQFTGPDDEELWDVEDGLLPDEDVPAPVRFLPEFDNILLSYDDRRRVMSDDDRATLMSAANGLMPGTYLVDGFVRGTWSVTSDRTTATLTLAPYRLLPKRDLPAVVAEAERLLDLLAPGRVRKVVMRYAG